MDKKIKTEIAVGIILILVFAIGGLVWMSAKKQSKLMLEIQTPPVSSVKQDVSASTNKAKNEQVEMRENIYTNDEFGFQITFPEGWDYKDIDVDAGTGSPAVYFSLAAQNKDYLSDVTGYENIFAINIWSLDAWNGYGKSQFQQNQDYIKILYKDKKQVFTYSQNPFIYDERVKNLFTDSAANGIISSFKLISKNNEISDWQTYKNDKLDIVFDYPSSWILSDESFNINGFKISFTTTSGDDVNISGNNDQNENEDYMQPYFGMCAETIKGLKQFCSDKSCIKINKNTALKYESPMMGERVYMAYIYSELSKKYPFLCIEASLNDMYEIVLGDGPIFDDGKGGYDIRAYIDNNEITKNMKDYIADLKRFAASIKK